jgi:Fe-S-cluster containining protein
MAGKMACKMISKEGFDFQFDQSSCNSCGGKCCIGDSAYAFISDDEIEKLSDLLNISVAEVHQNYVTKIDHRQTLNEVEIGDSLFACIFFDMDKRECSVYDARPEQCRTFPFWDEYLLFKDNTFYECPGVKLSVN